MGKIVLYRYASGTAGQASQTKKLADRGYKIHWLVLKIDTNATAGNRTVVLDVENQGGTILYNRVALATVAPSASGYLSASLQAAIAGISQIQLLAPMVVPKDAYFQVEINTGVQAGDVITDIYAGVEYDD